MVGKTIWFLEGNKGKYFCFHSRKGFLIQKKSQTIKIDTLIHLFMNGYQKEKAHARNLKKAFPTYIAYKG